MNAPPVHAPAAHPREFSLLALAREVWDEMGGCEYHVLAKEIARRIQPDDRLAALNEALVEYARHFNTRQGKAAPPKVSPSPVPTTGGAGGSTKPAAAQRNSARSSKVRAIREAWPQLRRYISTQDGRKALGDCTADNLIFHAGLLEGLANANAKQAEKERSLAALLKAKKVARVRDLPDSALAEYFEEGGSA